MHVQVKGELLLQFPRPSWQWSAFHVFMKWLTGSTSSQLGSVLTRPMRRFVTSTNVYCMQLSKLY